MKHVSVLLNESIENLNVKKDGIYVDATLGYAGHSSNILKELKRGFLFAFDQDIEAVNYSKKKLSEISDHYEIIHSNFLNLKNELTSRNIFKVDGILFDLGLSSPQIDESERGFSFQKEARLDMRMNQSSELSAYDVVNNYSENDLLRVFYDYGEEKRSKQIVSGIIKNRNILTTTELVEVIRSSVGEKYFNLEHPERKIFQAIRIEVNNELKVLESVLPDAINLLNKNGRICVITFHSLEDRIVKHVFKKYSEVNEMVKGLPVIPDEFKPLIKLINKKPILPSEEEIKNNPRSKSAKLRVIERV